MSVILGFLKNKGEVAARERAPAPSQSITDNAGSGTRQAIQFRQKWSGPRLARAGPLQGGHGRRHGVPR
jgi:hypothetical protein